MRGPSRQVDVAVPIDVLIADLMPVLLQHLGEELADNGLGHEGWVLQRLGGAALPEDDTIGSLDLRDGDTLYLRGRADQLPPVDFDDLVDGLATAVRGRGGRWTPGLTRATLCVLLILGQGVGLVLAALPGPPGPRATAAAFAALVGLVLANRAGRSPDLRGIAVAGLAGAIAYAAEAGLLAPTLSAGSLVWRTPQLLTAAVAVLGVAVLGLATSAWARPLLVGVLAAGLLVVAVGTLGLLSGLSAEHVGAVGVVLGTTLVTAVPLTSFRLAGLRLSPLPTQPEHLQEDLDPVPGQEVVDRAGQAQVYMTALYAGLAGPTALALVALGLAPGWAAATLACLASASLALTARPMTTARHRFSLLAAAAAGLTAVVVRLALDHPEWRAAGAVATVAVFSAACLLLARHLPGRRMMPYWGRIGDVAHLLVGVAMLPVLLAVLDVYGAVRAIGG